MKESRLLIITAILIILLSACDLDRVKVGGVRMMYGMNEAGRISYNIRAFTGTEKGELQAGIGKLIVFSYAADLEKGALFIEWQDPHGEVIWQKKLEASDRGTAEFKTLSPGIYKIFVQGRGAGGRFDVSWHEN